MTYLVDTHIFIWSIVDTKKLSKTVRKILEDSTNTILVSAVSLWEIAIKHSIGKLALENFNIQRIPEYWIKVDGVMTYAVARTVSRSALAWCINGW